MPAGAEDSRVEPAPGHPEILRILAPNPGPMTGRGTNTYIYGSDPCVVIDPGPHDADHVKRIHSAAAQRGGIGAILLTHDHIDHFAGVAPLIELIEADDLEPGTLLPQLIQPGEGEEHFGLWTIATPGHASDHVCFLTPDRVCFSGDLVLGAGSSLVPPDGGSLRSYMDSLRRVQAEPLELICPGHGPWIEDPAAKIAEYVEHREMRERGLVTALERGERSRQALLDEVWSDVSERMMPLAAMVMEAHLEKLESEGRIPGRLAS